MFVYWWWFDYRALHVLKLQLSPPPPSLLAPVKSRILVPTCPVYPWRFRIDTRSVAWELIPFSALSRRRLTPIKPVYPDGRLNITASAFNQPAVLVAGATATQNSPFSSIAVVVTIASTHCAYPRRDGQAELAWVAGYVMRHCLPDQRQSPIPVLTGFNVEQLRWSRPTRYRYTKPPPYLKWQH